jgi:hypothetical protein
MKSFLSFTALCLAAGLVCACEPPAMQRTEPAKPLTSVHTATPDSINPAQLAHIKTVQPVGSTQPIVVIQPPAPTVLPTPSPLCEPIDAANLAEYERLKKLLCAHPWHLVYSFRGVVTEPSRPPGYSIYSTQASIGWEYLFNFSSDGTVIRITTENNQSPQTFAARWCLYPTIDSRTKEILRGSFAWTLAVDGILATNYYPLVLTESDLRLGYTGIEGELDGGHFVPVRR